MKKTGWVEGCGWRFAHSGNQRGRARAVSFGEVSDLDDGIAHGSWDAFLSFLLLATGCWLLAWFSKYNKVFRLGRFQSVERVKSE